MSHNICAPTDESFTLREDKTIKISEASIHNILLDAFERKTSVTHKLMRSAFLFNGPYT